MSDPWEDFGSTATEAAPWEDFEKPKSRIPELYAKARKLNYAFPAGAAAQFLADQIVSTPRLTSEEMEKPLLPITPEMIPSGASPEIPTWMKPVTIPAVAAARGAVGLVGGLTSRKSLALTAGLATPAAPLALAKFAYDAAKGAGESAGDLSVQIENLARDPKRFTAEEWQNLADSTANTLLSLLFAGKITSGMFQKATGIRAPLGRLAEPERIRFAKDLSFELQKSKFNPEVIRTQPPLPPIPPGVVEPPPPAPPDPGMGQQRLAGMALDEQMEGLVQPGQVGVVRQALRNAVEPPLPRPREVSQGFLKTAEEIIAEQHPAPKPPPPNLSAADILPARGPLEQAKQRELKEKAKTGAQLLADIIESQKKVLPLAAAAAEKDLPKTEPPQEPPTEGGMQPVPLPPKPPGGVPGEAPKVPPAPETPGQEVLRIALEEQRKAGWDPKWPFVPADLYNADFRRALENDPGISAAEKQRIFAAGEKLLGKKGVPNAPKERIQPENNLRQHPGDGKGGTPPEPSGSSGVGERPPVAPETDQPSAAPGQARVLLNPYVIAHVQKAAKQGRPVIEIEGPDGKMYRATYDANLGGYREFTILENFPGLVGIKGPKRILDIVGAAALAKAGYKLPKKLPILRKNPIEVHPDYLSYGAKKKAAAASAAAVPPVIKGQLKADMESARRIAAMSGAEFFDNAQSFNKTNIELGLNATKEDIGELMSLRDKAQKQYEEVLQKLKDKKPIDDKDLALVSKPQYFNEAIAIAKAAQVIGKEEMQRRAAEIGTPNALSVVADQVLKEERLNVARTKQPKNAESALTTDEIIDQEYQKAYEQKKAKQAKQLKESEENLPEYVESGYDENGKFRHYFRLKESVFDKNGKLVGVKGDTVPDTILRRHKVPYSLPKEAPRVAPSLGRTALGEIVARRLESRSEAERIAQEQYGIVVEDAESPNRWAVVVPPAGEPPVRSKSFVENEPPKPVTRGAPQETAPAVTGEQGTTTTAGTAAPAPSPIRETTPGEQKAQGPVERLAAEGKTAVAGTPLEKWADEQLKGGATHLGPDVIAAYLVKGYGLMERGVIKWSDWARQMIQEHGPSIQPFLKSLYAEAKAAFEQKTSTSTGWPLKRARSVIDAAVAAQAKREKAQGIPPVIGSAPAPAPAAAASQPAQPPKPFVPGATYTSRTPPPPGAYNVTQTTVNGRTTYTYQLPGTTPAAAAAPAQPTTTPAPAAPAVVPSATPPVIPVGGLERIRKIFRPEEPKKTPIKEKAVRLIEGIRTGFSSKFRPLNMLAEDIAKAYGLPKKDIAGLFEQLKGSSGKGEAQIYKFDRDVSDLVGSNVENFNVYMFITRSLDRLKMDLKDIQAAQAGEEVGQLNRRQVADYLIPMLETDYRALESEVGPRTMAEFKEAGSRYQKYMDEALRLQLESGRLSKEMYDKIKAENEFYAPFFLIEHIERVADAERTGGSVDTTTPYSYQMTGIKDPNFKLADMLSAARQNILVSRILADKSIAMRNIADLAKEDYNELFIRKLKRGQKAPGNWESVNVFENGEVVRYATDKRVADAVSSYGKAANPFIETVLKITRATAVPFRLGATVLNIQFQPVNLLLADMPNAVLVSKYGIRAGNIQRIPMLYAQAIFSAIQGRVFGKSNKMMLDFLESGAAGTTYQEYLTPEAIKYRDPSKMTSTKRKALGILYAFPEFATAIEQASKIYGVQRAMELHGMKSGAELAKKLPQTITEIRRFSGSPDFGRMGSVVGGMGLSLLYMFFNARIQGTVATVGRLTGREGAAEAAKTWLVLGTAVGAPTILLHLLNNNAENKPDYDKLHDWEKKNYWMIPKDLFGVRPVQYITDDEGNKIRDYYRIPKREASQLIGNMVESALTFAQERDPQGFADFAVNTLENVSPVNIQGKTTLERGESIISGLHPIPKTAIEQLTGRDTFRHQQLIRSEAMQRGSPENQFVDRTPEGFKVLAKLMPDWTPEWMRSPLRWENVTRNFTGGLITQFMSGKPVEGRSKWENLPMVQRFQRAPFAAQEDAFKRIDELQRESADDYLARYRESRKLIQENKGKTLAEIAAMASKPEVIPMIVDLYVGNMNGVTRLDHSIIALPPKQRAKYLIDQLKAAKSSEDRKKLIEEWSKKRILTQDTWNHFGDYAP